MKKYAGVQRNAFKEGTKRRESKKTGVLDNKTSNPGEGVWEDLQQEEQMDRQYGMTKEYKLKGWGKER